MTVHAPEDAYRYGDPATGGWTPDCIGELAAFILQQPRDDITDDDILSVVTVIKLFDPDDGATDIVAVDRAAGTC